MIRAQDALHTVALILSASASRPLSSSEHHELEGLCSIIAEGIPTRPISSYALRKFAEKVRNSGLTTNGQADDLKSLLEDAESLKFLTV